MAEPDFRTLFEAAPGLFLALEPRAPFAIVAVSDAFARATLRSRGDLVGKSLSAVFPEEPIGELAASLERVVRSRAPDALPIRRRDVRREAGDGLEERWWSPLSSPALAPDGTVAYVLHRLDDVTELVSLVRGASKGSLDAPLSARELLSRVEDLVAERRRAEEALARAIRARDEVLGIVAHDLRNPLNVIILQTTILGRRGAPDRRNPEPIEHIRRAASRMDRLIQDLLDVARLEAGRRLAVERRRLPVATLVRDAVESLGQLAAAASIELALDVHEGLPDAWADRDRLLQVFENLIGNAVKFTKPGGSVTLGAVAAQGELVFRVADTGPGIPPELLPRVFERFWQAERSDRRGAGLGLSVVKGIVEAHEGRVWVESRTGVGTTFFFSVPSVVAEPAPPPRPPSPPRASSAPPGAPRVSRTTRRPSR
jgi:signal transduction histidine kinase